jgi:SAM-dependent methyltransferase
MYELVRKRGRNVRIEKKQAMAASDVSKDAKKKLRLKALRRHLGYLSEEIACFLVTCGDNNGAMNYHLREMGGRWSWADLESVNIHEMSRLLGEPVFHVSDSQLPFSDETFDCVVSIDVLEHLEDPHQFTQELWRVTKPGGRVIITVPNGDETKLATRFKNAVGMTKDTYGHVREGYEISELREIMRVNRIDPYAESSFSRFFVEILELSINFLYVKVLSRKNKAKVAPGTVAPGSEAQLRSVERTYKLYSFVYPLFWLISKLDSLFYFSAGYCVVVEGRKN